MVKEPKTSPKSSEGSTIRKRSPGRNKSPGRNSTLPTENVRKSTRPRSSTRKSQTYGSPARNNSPSRIKKDTSPAYISPKRKLPSRTADSRNSSKKAIIQQSKVDNELSESDNENIPKEKPKATVRGRTRRLELDDVVQADIKLTSDTDPLKTYIGEIRRFTRNSQAKEERVVHIKHFDTITKKLGEFSDDDDISLLSSKPSEKKQKSSILESVGTCFQIIFSQVFLTCLYLFCDNIQCSFKSFPNWNRFKSFSVFFDLRAFLGYSALAVTLAILSSVPFGGKRVSNLPSKQGKFIYVTNGFASFVIIGTIFATLEYFRFPVSRFIFEHIIQLLISATIFGAVFSVYLYLRSFYVLVSCLNPTEIDASSVNAFFYGREVNPRMFNILDLKMYLLRLRCISLILADTALLMKGLNFDANLGLTIANFDWKLVTSNSTLLILVALHFIHAVDSLCFESRSLSSYFVQYEGLGYKNAVGLLLSPFLLIAQTKYVIEYNIHLADWQLVLVSMVYCVGYMLYRLSNNQKDAFRRNPYGPGISNLESISTSQGKKLLSSGYWGLVRQPNILGDILMHVALILFSYNVPPLIGIIAIILMLIERSVISQTACKSKYGGAWEKYCQKVRYVLVPKVY
ncbi:hypothetical protein WA026_018109 [Henosepilachna vigintioctopunctata]|uniref:Lamin-B receptor n=1 Tax=Henosepilachna vigintioctopunctata TaxID=420089 RepID=A0AAW1UPL9_9CUCU